MLNRTSIISELMSQWDYDELIFNRITELLDYYLSIHSRVIVVRFDLTFPEHYTQVSHNRLISKFIQKLIQKYQRQKNNPCYIWVREQNMSDHPHYHCALLLNGHKIQSFYHVFLNAQNLWSSTLGIDASGQIDHCNRYKYYGNFSNGIMIDKHTDDAQAKYEAVIRQLSYLAKARDKRDYGDPWRNFGMSELH